MAEVLIETYEIEEAEWPTDDANKDEYLETIQKLELTGQQELVGQEGCIPFQRMDDKVTAIWKAFAPKQETIHNYREGRIPLKLLVLVGICKEKGWFYDMEVWSESYANPDPIIVGRVKMPNGYSYAYYMIGRWGEALLSWPEVVKIAKEKWIAKAKADLQERIGDAQDKMQRLDSMADTWAHGKYVSI